MGEYVININWSGGKGSSGKGNTTPTAFLAGAAISRIFDENSVAPDTLYGVNNVYDEEGQTVKQWQIIQQEAVLSQVNRFF